MSDLTYVYATGLTIALVLIFQVASRRFDPFAPIWLFLVGYVQLYIIQPISLRDWALGIRGSDVVAAADLRAFWALPWFLLFYFSGIGRRAARLLPKPPTAWSSVAVGLLTPLLIAWGFYCALVIITQGWGETERVSSEETLFRSFPFLMMVAGILLIITGRVGGKTRLLPLGLGLGVAAAYVVIWMFNGKRSHSLIGVLSTVCAFYITRQKRPSWPVLLSTAFAGALVVAVSIGWRNNYNYERSFAGFVQYIGDFRFTSILKSLNIEDEDEIDPRKAKSYETEEWGGFLLMLDTVPEKSDYDYGANYIRVFSTYVPRILWPNKPVYGRDKWIAAWMLGSELKRDEEFTGPAIGILGATQLNGGVLGTMIVMAVVAIMIRTGYEYFLLYDTVSWVQAWWALTFYNSWFMVVADDPANWFYYNWGNNCMPSFIILWVVNKLFGSPSPES